MKKKTRVMKLELSMEEVYFLINVLVSEVGMLSELDKLHKQELGHGIAERSKRVENMINKLQTLKMGK